MSSLSELIQWKTAKMRGNKACHGFGGFIFLVFELFSVAWAALPFGFAPPFNDSRQSLKGMYGTIDAYLSAVSGNLYRRKRMLLSYHKDIDIQ